MTDTIGTGLAETLADHVQLHGIRDMRMHCICGWESEVRGGMPAYAAHLAVVAGQWFTDWLASDDVRDAVARGVASRWAADAALEVVRAVLGGER